MRAVTRAARIKGEHSSLIIEYRVSNDGVAAAATDSVVPPVISDNFSIGR